MMNKPADAPYRILSLAGGGYLGLYTACVLVELEAMAGEPLGRRFDLIAGTSVGGILAIALAYEMPMAAVRELFLQHGTAIFSGRGLATGLVGKLRDLSRSVIGPKYDGQALRHALVEHLGRRTLGQALHHMVVPTTNVSLSRTKVFKTPHGPGSLGDERAHAVSVAMATCAAPSYFPAVRIGRHLYADGGMYAVAPDQIALHEAEHFLQVPSARIHMLSVGTGIARYQPSAKVSERDGAVDWLSEGRLILTLIAVQQQHVQAMLEDRLGERYLLIDGEWPRNAQLGLDVATPAAAAALTQLAKTSVRRMDAERVRREFLAPRI